MSFSDSLKLWGFQQVLHYIHKEPQANMEKAVGIARKLAPGEYKHQVDAVEDVIKDQDSANHQFVMKILEQTDEKVFDTFATNFMMGSLLSAETQKKAKEKYQCNVPWTILLDPTTACNLKCVGCWAAEYGKSLNLSLEEIDSIIEQGKELGIYFYIFTGGEPLVRKKDIIEICRKHKECEFLMFTNGTLIDEEFADTMLELANLVPALSIEGSEETTDARRGEGCYQKVLKAMDILRARKLPFGVSICYTAQNYKAVTSEEFVDFIIDKGALFAWYFHFMPVGNDTSSDLLLSPDQREHVFRTLRGYRTKKQIFFMDFQNDGQYVGGCIAGGRTYLHINANGDVEPCVFIHYSDSNIREKTLIEALQSPLFMAYKEGQPFNQNMLQPCPMLENPKLLREIVQKTGAASTDILEQESVDHLCAKCDDYAAAWAPKADELWEEEKAHIAAQSAQAK